MIDFIRKAFSENYATGDEAVAFVRKPNSEDYEVIVNEESIFSIRLSALEDAYVKASWFEQVNSGTTGTVTLPEGATIVLDEWAGGVDALASTMSSDIPTYSSPTTSLLVKITATLDGSGNYSLSGTPSAYPVAVIYVYKVSLKDLDITKVLGGVEIITPGVVDVPIDGDTLSAISANWAYDHNLRDATASVQGHATAVQITKLDGIEASAVALSTVKADVDIASAISLKHTQGTDTALGTLGTKNPPIDADLVIYRDSTASNALVTSTWTQIKAFLKTYYDTLYNLYVHPNHSGEVTSVADGAQTIATNAVTNAKLAQMATKTYKGRTTVGTGNTEDVAVATLKTDLILVKADVGLGNVENTAHSTDAHTMTIDGRDVSADGSKLDGIETGADVTDSVNVDAAGATMNADTNVKTNSWVIDEDNMASNLDTKVPTQQSVKAYVDSIGGTSFNTAAILGTL